MKAKATVGLLAVAVMLTATLHGDDAKKKVNLKGVKCAMNLKGPAKNTAASSVAFKGGKVYFCCGNCPKAFTKGLKDSKKKGQLVANANWQLVATKQAKATGKCPLAGRPINPKQTTKVNGVSVAFCCPGCKGKVAKEKDAKKQIALVFGNEKKFKASFKTPADKKKKA